MASCARQMEVVEIRIAGESFRVEVARTREEQARGLMERRAIGDREGMLFVYREDRRLKFWMKNTSIPLSIAFMNRQGKIVQIENMQPFDATTVPSKISVRYALEVQQGTFEKLGVRVGDMISLPDGFK